MPQANNEQQSWVWLFDLDNTLHDASQAVFPRISESMTRYLVQHLGLTEADAHALRIKYWQRYGATLSGLVRHHGVNPHHFLQETHQFPDLLDILRTETALGRQLASLPGRKIIFTNAPRHYARAVLHGLKVDRLFDDVWGLEDIRFFPKPSLKGYQQILRHTGVDPSRVIMVEDTLENLRTARRLGMKTVLVSPDMRKPSWVDARVKNIAAMKRIVWLRARTGKE